MTTSRPTVAMSSTTVNPAFPAVSDFRKMRYASPPTTIARMIGVARKIVTKGSPNPWRLETCHICAAATARKSTSVSTLNELIVNPPGFLCRLIDPPAYPSASGYTGRSLTIGCGTPCGKTERGKLPPAATRYA
jgi:hypothetical protein